jgi:hypothetical protein
MQQNERRYILNVTATSESPYRTSVWSKRTDLVKAYAWKACVDWRVNINCIIWRGRDTCKMFATASLNYSTVIPPVEENFAFNRFRWVCAVIQCIRICNIRLQWLPGFLILSEDYAQAKETVEHRLCCL